MTGLLENKVATVTGAGAGIGAAIAQALGIQPGGFDDLISA